MTIFAPSTPPGVAALSVFRISGKEAKKALEALTEPTCPLPRQASLKVIKNPVSRETIDHALVLYFNAPHSFTGEDVVELHTHGGRAIYKAILDALNSLPYLRMAEPGEFTRQAFINNKMDLTAAEGIADLIHAETSAQHRQALRMVEGELETLYESYRAKLLRSMALVEAYIDFPDEDIPESVYDELRGEVNGLKNTLSMHLCDNRRGERIREGIYCVIIGAPNVGKSTLMNYLAKRDVSIVSQTAGTTRDVIEVHLSIAGYPVILADTAGLRETNDEIENEGIKRALARAQNADLKIAVFDASASSIDQTTLSQIDENTLVLINKSDIASDISHLPSSHILLSLKEGKAVDDLLKSLEESISSLFFSQNSPIITRARHRKAIEQAVWHLDRFSLGGEIELMGEELRLAAHALASVTGKVEIEEILGEIFSSFCIGK